MNKFILLIIMVGILTSCGKDFNEFKFIKDVVNKGDDNEITDIDYLDKMISEDESIQALEIYSVSDLLNDDKWYEYINTNEDLEKIAVYIQENYLNSDHINGESWFYKSKDNNSINHSNSKKVITDTIYEGVLYEFFFNSSLEGNYLNYIRYSEGEVVFAYQIGYITIDLIYSCNEVDEKWVVDINVLE